MMDVLRRLVKLNNDFQFLLYCDDGSEDYRAFAAQFRTLNVNVITRPTINNYLEFLASLDDVAVGLAPLVNTEGFSGGKSFGKVLAYMDREVPIVTHPVVDHPLFFKNGENAYLLESADEWARGIAKLLADPGERQRLATGARVDLERRLSTDEAARRVDAILKAALHEVNWPGS
jgi:glycosyltransferase involved in cell wall biosynthesis